MLSAILTLMSQHQVAKHRISWSRIWFLLAFLAFVAFAVARYLTGSAGTLFAVIAGTAYAALLPVQYLFVRAFCGDPAKLIWPHAIFPGLNIALSVFLVLNAEVNSASGVFNSDGSNLRWTAVLTLAVVSVALLYPGASLRRLWRARKAHRISGGRRAARHFNWLIVWCGSTVLIGLVSIAADLVELGGGLAAAIIAILSYGMLCLQLVILGLYVTRNARAFEAVAGKPADFSADAAELSRHLKQTHAYRQPGLSIERLAEQISWPAARLTAAVKASGSTHFNDYLNAWRIEDVVMTLESGSDSTLLDIALEAGFGSKTSFNDAFKKHMGVSPSAFRQSLTKGPDFAKSV